MHFSRTRERLDNVIPSQKDVSIEGKKKTIYNTSVYTLLHKSLLNLSITTLIEALKT
jgi:hypothetical protein